MASYCALGRFFERDALLLSLGCEDSRVKGLLAVQSHCIGCVRIESTREIMPQYDCVSSLMGMCSADSSVLSTKETEDLEFPS